MKKKFFTLLAGLIISVLCLAQNNFVSISGYVTNSNTGAPIPDHQVCIHSAIGSNIYSNCVYTDAQGWYTDTMETTLMQGTATVFTFDCTGDTIIQTATFYPGGFDIQVNFQICYDSTQTDCHAYFTYSPAYCGNFSFGFFDNSSSNVNFWYWNFGDGTASTEQNPCHIFASEGFYTVCLYALVIDTATQNVLCTDTYCEDIIVGNPLGCVVGFNYVISPQNPFNYQFYPTLSTNNIPIHDTNYYWDFGDSTFSTEPSPLHTFFAEGTYPVCLTISLTDPMNDSIIICEDTYCETIVVDTTDTQVYCQAGFTYYPDTMVNCCVIQFINQSVNNSQYDVMYLWDFGDGDSAIINDNSPISHHYANAGAYYVCLTMQVTVQGVVLCQNEYCETITVGAPSYYHLGGQVFAGVYPIDYGIAFLFHVFNNAITAVDYAIIDTLGYYYFYQLVQGDYKVLVAYISDTSNYDQNNPAYAPTYYGNVLFWQDAQTINLTANIWDADIHLIPVDSCFGPGSINGNVEEVDSGKSVVENLEVLLLDMSNNPVAYTYTDGNGNFSFSNLAYGTYQVYAEACGYYTIPVIVTLDENNPTVNDIQLQVSETEISGFVNYESKPITTVGNIYPNPANQDVNILVNLETATDLIFIITNTIGQKLMDRDVKLNSGVTMVKLPVNNLLAGSYILNIVSSDWKVNYVRRFVK